MRYYSALVIRNSDGHFLAANHVKKTEHPWRFFGGKIEEGEMPIVAAAREAKEELGIVPTAMQLVGTPVIHVDGDDWMGYFFLVDNYEGTPTIQEPHKHAELKYLSCSELSRLESHPEFDVAIDITLYGDN